MANKKAVVLLSGGLDSAVTLYLAKRRGFNCRCLILDYGQQHKTEIDSARAVARSARCRYQVLRLKLPWKGSSLLDKNRAIPRALTRARRVGIPSTYVPGRNIIFLSLALSFAEAAGAEAIFIGAHMQDYSGYPDCRSDFFQAFGKAAKRGTKSGVQGRGIAIHTPLINKNKSGIIRLGLNLGVPFELTWSCYRGGHKPCGSCESCYFRARGFAEAGVADPLSN